MGGGFTAFLGGLPFNFDFSKVYGPGRLSPNRDWSILERRPVNKFSDGLNMDFSHRIRFLARTTYETEADSCFSRPADGPRPSRIRAAPQSQNMETRCARCARQMDAISGKWEIVTPEKLKQPVLTQSIQVCRFSKNSFRDQTSRL